MLKHYRFFSYIRPVDGATRLIVYNCSNITCLEQVVHRGSKVVVEVPDGCMIVLQIIQYMLV